jgi:hypothetical protein
MHDQPNPYFVLFFADIRTKFVEFKVSFFFFEIFKTFASKMGRNA